MLKFTVAVLAVVLGSAASAAGWRSLRIDGSSEDSFSRSVGGLQEKLSPGRRYVFERALQDIWLEGTTDAEAGQREFTATEYFRQLDGLGYKDVVRFTDPSGETARMRYRQADALLRTAPRTANSAAALQFPPGPIGFSGEQVRGMDNQVQAMQQRLSDKGHLH